MGDHGLEERDAIGSDSSEAKAMTDHRTFVFSPG
jgi:hypothetical protein